MAYDVTNFQQDVIERSHTVPVLADFWADWCGPCKVLDPVLEKLASQNEGAWVLAKVDTEQHVDVAGRYEIRSIPNVKLFIDGVVVNEFVGVLPEYQIQRWLQNAIPGKHRKQIEQAEAFLAAGNHSAARALLEQVVPLDPGNTFARILLAQSVAFSDPPRASSLIENLDEPKHSDILEAIQTFAQLRELAPHAGRLPESDVRQLYVSALQSLFVHDFGTALQRFIDVIRQERYYQDDSSRKACIAIFKLLGEEHPITQKYRREFSSALY